VTFPIIEAPEHDSVLLYCAADKTNASADPPVTEVVNTAIQLFALALPLQTSKVQESSVEQIATLLSSHSLQRNPGRKAAMTMNVAVALLHALKVANKEIGKKSLPFHLDSSVEKILQELIQVGALLLKLLI
jgi:HEAT repeat-containing protein 5